MIDVSSHNNWDSENNNGGGSSNNRRPMRTSNREEGGGGNIPFSKMVFDGKRMRKAIQRRTVDYNHSVARWMQVSLLSVLWYNLFTYIYLGASMDSRQKRHTLSKARS